MGDFSDQRPGVFTQAAVDLRECGVTREVEGAKWRSRDRQIVHESLLIVYQHSFSQEFCCRLVTGRQGDPWHSLECMPDFELSPCDNVHVLASVLKWCEIYL